MSLHILKSDSLSETKNSLDLTFDYELFSYILIKKYWFMLHYYDCRNSRTFSFFCFRYGRTLTILLITAMFNDLDNHKTEISTTSTVPEKAPAPDDIWGGHNSRTFTPKESKSTVETIIAVISSYVSWYTSRKSRLLGFMWRNERSMMIQNVEEWDYISVDITGAAVNWNITGGAIVISWSCRK